MKTIGKNIFLTMVLIAGSAVSAAAQESAAMSFIDNSLTPRMAAMGGIAAGLRSDAYAQFGNIAAVPFSEKTLAAGVTYDGLQPSAAGINTGVLGATYRIGRFGVTLGASMAFNQPYEGVDENGNALGKFTPVDWNLGAGVSYLITDAFSAGVGLNYATSITSPYYRNLNTFYASVQLMYRLKEFSFSLSGNVSYSNVWGKHGLEAAVDGKAYFGGPSALGCAVGAEYEYDSLLAVRAGYHYGSTRNGLPSFASVGLGAHFFGVNVDVAYLIACGNSPLRNTFSVGVGYSF